MKQDKLSQLIEKGAMEALLKLLRGWNYAQGVEKVAEFLETKRAWMQDTAETSTNWMTIRRPEHFSLCIKAK
jgi:hypothetical protein